MQGGGFGKLFNMGCYLFLGLYNTIRMDTCPTLNLCNNSGGMPDYLRVSERADGCMWGSSHNFPRLDYYRRHCISSGDELQQICLRPGHSKVSSKTHLSVEPFLIRKLRRVHGCWVASKVCFHFAKLPLEVIGRHMPMSAGDEGQ